MSQWYYTRNGQEFGPVTSDELRELAAANELEPSDLLWQEGMADWSPAHRVKNLFNVDAATALTAELIAPSPVLEEAARPVAAAPLLYFSPAVDLSDKAAAVLRGFGAITGRRGDWPLSEHTLVEFATASAARNPIRRAAALYFVLCIIGIGTSLLFVILFLQATSNIRSAGLSLPVKWSETIVGIFVVWFFQSVLFYFTSRGTYKCQLWAPITMIVLFSAWIIYLIVEVIIQIRSFMGLSPDEAVIYIFTAVPPAIFLIMSINALVNIRRFLRRPLWCIHLLVGAKL